MEAASRAPDMIVVGGDEEGRLQIRPVMEGGSRSVEIHLWRSGTSETPPARDVLDLDLPDLDSLQQGISELVEASEGGTRVARIVLDTAEGRRLRLETEPFGTRFVARVVFWQRSRVTWRPDGDPIVLPADLLPQLHEALAGLRSWLDEPLDRQLTAAIPIVPEPWPNPGADWLTVDRSSVAFHPRGVRITCSIEEHGDDHVVNMRQWRREDSLWVPERALLSLSPSDLDALLTALQALSGKTDPTSVEAGEKLRISITGDPPNLVIDQRSDGGFERSLAFPLEHLARFGRALSQSWTLLAGWLSDSERDQLREEHQTDLDATVSMAAVDAMPAPAPPPEPQPIGPTFRFAARSDTPGTVIPQEGRVRIVLEGVLMPRGLTLPAVALPSVITGLEELHERQKAEWRVPPLLMYERPDCTVYGRVGTNVHPDAVELRVWTGPRDSDALTFEKQYLPEAIRALRESARLLGEPEPLPVPTATTPAADAPVQRRDDLDTTVTLPAIAPEPEPIHIGEVRAGSLTIQLDLVGPEDQQRLSLSWEGGALDLAPATLDTLLTDVRTLYYDALRGMRGRSVRIEDPPLEAALLSRGGTLYLELRGPETTLAFPAGEIPAFLNAIRAALNI